MSTPRQKLRELGIPPLKRFGQHFLLDEKVRDAMIAAAEVDEGDIVLEVGPGLGFLTEALIRKARRVIIVEKDRTLAADLRRKFEGADNLEIIQGDVFKVSIPEYSKIVSSPPYNISSKLVFFILGRKFELASLLLQEEFARRLLAESGTRDYGRLTVMFQTEALAEIVRKVNRNLFYPSPRVDSALVKISPADDKIPLENEALFEEMVRALFTQRRRKLSSVLKRFLESKYKARNIIGQLKVPEGRVYEAPPEDLAELSNQVARLIV